MICVFYNLGILHFNMTFVESIHVMFEICRRHAFQVDIAVIHLFFFFFFAIPVRQTTRSECIFRVVICTALQEQLLSSRTSGMYLHCCALLLLQWIRSPYLQIKRLDCMLSRPVHHRVKVPTRVIRESRRHVRLPLFVPAQPVRAHIRGAHDYLSDLVYAVIQVLRAQQRHALAAHIVLVSVAVGPETAANVVLSVLELHCGLLGLKSYQAVQLMKYIKSNEILILFSRYVDCQVVQLSGLVSRDLAPHPSCRNISVSFSFQRRPLRVKLFLRLYSSAQASSIESVGVHVGQSN